MKTGLLIGIFGLLAGSLSAQLPTMRFEWIAAKEGLPGKSVNCAAEDKRGFMWFGTRQGLTRYDGYEFVSLNTGTLNTGEVTGLGVDPAGTLWATGENTKLQTIDPISRTPQVIDNQKNGPAYSAFVDSFGHIWYSDRAGVNRYDPVRQKRYVYPMKQTSTIFHKGSFVEDHQRNVWVLGMEVGLFRFDRARNRLTCVFGLDYPRPGLNFIGQVGQLRRGFVDRQNRFWIPTPSQKLLCYDPKRNQLRLFDAPGHLCLVAAEGLDERGRTIVWVGSDKDLGVFRPDTETFHWFSHAWPGQAWPGPFIVYDIVRSPRNGQVWVCTSEGILHYNPHKQAVQSHPMPFRHAAGLNPNVNAILQDRTDSTGQTFWLAVAYQGLVRWNRRDNTTRLFRLPVPYADRTESVWLVQDRQNHIWMGGNQWQAGVDDQPDNRYEGIFRFDPLRERFLPLPFTTHHQFFSVPFHSLGLLDSRNRLWITNHYEGIHVVNAESGQPIKLWEQSAHDTLMKGGNWVMDVFEDSRHRYWFATYQGLWYLDEARRQFVNVGTRYPNNTFRGSNALLKLTEDRRGNLWVVGWHVLAKVSPGGRILKQWTEANGLGDRECRRVAVDAQDRVWIGTYDGLQVFDETKNAFNRLTVNDGLLSNEAIAGFCLPNGRELFVGSHTGWNAVDIEKYHRQSPTTRIELADLRVNDQPYPLPASQPLRLSRNQNSVAFAFSALNFEKVDQNQYECYLEGWDRDWHTLGTRHEISYSNLPPNEYTFHAKLRNAPAEAGIRLPLAIAPHVYETSWFRTLLALLLGAVLIYFYVSRQHYKLLLSRLQTEEAQRRQKEAEFNEQETAFRLKLSETEMTALRAQMNPHFIFNCLNSIKLYTLQNDVDRASDYLTKFSLLIRLVLENSRSELVPLQSELEALQLYIELEAMRFKQKVQFSIVVSPKIDQRYICIPPLLLQPYVENAIWHGLMHKPEGGTVTVEVSQPQDNLLHIEITDDGVGRERAAELKSRSAGKHKSFGMQMTADRIRMINQLYNIQTQAQVVDLVDSFGDACGTRVILEIPV